MIRRLAVAALAVALLPASAEAAKFRFGGGRSSTTHAGQGQRDGSHAVVTPTLRSRQTQNAAASEPLRIATPATAATVETADLRGTQSAEARVWCRSQTVVGGFCVMN